MTADPLDIALDAVLTRQSTPEAACLATGGGPDELADLILADRLAKSLTTAAPTPEFLELLEARLRVAGAAAVDGGGTLRSTPAPPAMVRAWPVGTHRPPHGSPLLGLATAAVLVLALGLAALLVARPQPANAQEIVTRARNASAALVNGKVQSFELVMRASGPDDLAAMPGLPQPAPGTWLREDRDWYQAPDRFRSETRFLRRPDGSQDAAPSVLVADGQALWSYDPALHLLQIHTGTLGGPTKGGLGFFGAEGSLSAVLAQGTCFPHPALTGSERVAGRDSYVLDLGPTACPSAAAGRYNGDVTVWIDKQTFFVLKSVTRETSSTRVALTQEVTSIRYNVPLPASLFSFTPPAGTRVLDARATPTPLRRRAP